MCVEFAPSDSEPAPQTSPVSLWHFVDRHRESARGYGLHGSNPSFALTKQRGYTADCLRVPVQVSGVEISGPEK